MANDEELVTNITPAALIGVLNRDKEGAPSQDPDFEEATLAPEIREQRRLSRKPIIDHLKPGTVSSEGEVYPTFNIGDRVVVERRSSLLQGNPWLDTQIFTVENIDDDTGIVRGRNEELLRGGFFSFKDELTIVKIAPARGNPFKAANIAREEKKAEKKATLKPGEKIRRGRPKGSKNRSKDEIKAEKLARKAERDAKKAKRKGGKR